MDKQNDERPLRVFLWMVPRTYSTVLMKCLSFVDGAEVWFEPYLACHFNKTVHNSDWDKGNPAAERAKSEVDEIRSTEEYKALIKLEIEKRNKYKNIWPQSTFNYHWLKEQLSVDPKDKKIIFVKEESFTIKDHMEYLPDVPIRHVFLIRHPQEVYTSLKDAFVNQFKTFQFPWDDYHLGDNVPYLPVENLFQIHYDLWKYIKENLESDPVVIDGFDLVSHPEVILPKFFERLDIPYKETYLQWCGDPEVAYSTWKGSSEFVVIDTQTTTASRAVESTSFEPPKYPRGTSRPEWKITDELKEYIEGAMPYYEEMYENRLV
ncbi:hypothetical protein HOLleu_14074 [Holothuria leucospilota]|uniref:Sulfotransferase family protein n=1 Tax=Holothuria leucospilota TaxID=206669 RepID=A0A9Q1C845_HOLLE|nr:hypothetical protein HOLleu_14074 [Holothuria leucospilota]